MFIPSIVIAVLSENLIFGEIYRKNYRKSICRPFSNYRSNCWYWFYTFWSYLWFWRIVGNIINIKSLREIIEKWSLSKNLTFRPLLLSGGRDFHDSWFYDWVSMFETFIIFPTLTLKFFCGLQKSKYQKEFE